MLEEINRRQLFMTYMHDIGNGQRLLVENDGDNTQVALSSGDSGQQQNQSAGFNTGKWSKPPELFRTTNDQVLRLESNKRHSVDQRSRSSNPIDEQRPRSEECGKTHA